LLFGAPEIRYLTNRWLMTSAPPAKTPKNAAARRTRVLLVDDHPLIRQGLAEVIQREPDLMVCGEAEDRAQALKLIDAARPDLAIVDLTLKHSHGLDLIKDMRAAHPRVIILVVSMHDESLHAERVIRAGALGYITKQEAARNVLGAIRRVLAGEVFLSEKISSQLAARMVGHARAATGTPVEGLSDRELQVFELLGQGRTSRQIAAHLGVDVKTVQTYNARIKEKLRLADATELLQHAILWQQRGAAY
jgi:DNA-binding NarL/FixJ family response regulator